MPEKQEGGKERKYYFAGPEKPPIFVQAIIDNKRMSPVDFFHITDAYLDWDKAGDDDAVLEPLIAFLSRWGDEFLYIRCVALVNSKRFYNDIVKGRRKLKGDLEFEAILYVPGRAWARLHGKDSKDYPHVTEFCYETMSNAGGWSEDHAGE